MPDKADKYVTSMDEFKEAVEGMEKSDINRDKVIKRLQEEFEMSKDMINQMFSINEKGKLEMKQVTDKMLSNYKIQEDEER